MSKRLTFYLLLLLAAVLLLAHTTRSEIKLTATKIEMDGKVKLVWTKQLNANSTTQYSLYRTSLSDSATILLVTKNDTSYTDLAATTILSTPKSYVYRVTAKTGTVTELSNYVTVTIPIVSPVGSYRLDGKIDSGTVKLSWQQPPVGTVKYYLVYRGKLGDASPLHTLIDSTVIRVSNSPYPALPNPGVQTTFVYYIKAFLTSGDILISTSLQLTVYPKPVKDDLKFITAPNLGGQKDVKYSYTAKAASSDPIAIIRYYGWATFGVLTVNLPDFKIDSATGTVDWTPKSKGYYSVNIIARSSKGGEAKQNFSVKVSGGNGIIQGKVSDTLNAAIPNTIVEIFKTENNSATSFAYSVRTDQNGNFRINRIDPGSYKLRANSPSTKYQSQWYDGKREVFQADIVSVIDSPAVSIANFKLRSGASNVPRVNVSGFVFDTTEIAINDADCRVIFVRAEFALNLNMGPNPGSENIRKYFEFNPFGDYRLEGNSEFIFKVKADSVGKFKVGLPPGGYIAFARAKGYATEFYKNQVNILTAEVIRIQKDTAGINFTLSPLPLVALGEIRGAVIDSVKRIPIPSRVIAMRDGWRMNDPHRIGKVYVTDADSMGHYKFDDVLPGTYVVMALPLGNYAPSYYANDSINFRWKRANKIVVNGNSIDDINIYVRPIGSLSNGYAGITGFVNTGNGNGPGGGMNRAGAIVYAYRGNEIVGYSLTNPDGLYAIFGIAPGQYSVFVDKPGFHESNIAAATVSYDPLGNPQVGSANFTIDAVLGVSERTAVQPTQYVLEQNYPNPFNPVTTIGFSLPQSGNVSLKVFNLVGQEVSKLISGYREAGQYAVSFNASSLASGVYFYRIESPTFTMTKKMLLIK